MLTPEYHHTSSSILAFVPTLLFTASIKVVVVCLQCHNHIIMDYDECRPSLVLLQKPATQQKARLVVTRLTKMNYTSQITEPLTCVLRTDLNRCSMVINNLLNPLHFPYQ